MSNQSKPNPRKTVTFSESRLQNILKGLHDRVHHRLDIAHQKLDRLNSRINTAEQKTEEMLTHLIHIKWTLVTGFLVLLATFLLGTLFG